MKKAKLKSYYLRDRGWVKTIKGTSMSNALAREFSKKTKIKKLKK